MKAISYLCALITAMYVMVPATTDSEVDKTRNAIIYTDPIKKPAISYEVEKKKRDVALLKSQVVITLAEIRSNKLK